jgi:hypothetical protein
MSITEEPDAVVPHVRICGEPARISGLVYPTCAKKSLGALNRSLEADVKESEGTRWVKSHPAKSSQQPEASFASCDGDMQGEA